MRWCHAPGSLPPTPAQESDISGRRGAHATWRADFEEACKTTTNPDKKFPFHRPPEYTPPHLHCQKQTQHAGKTLNSSPRSKAFAQPNKRTHPFITPPGASGTNRAPRPIPRTTPATCPVGQPRCSRGTGGIGVDPTGRSSACPLLPPIWSSVFPRLLTQPATLSTPPMNSRIDRLLCWLARRQSGR